MTSKFKISIAEPCYEQWNNMHTNERGKFCGSCQKSVVDFTSFSDSELKKWFTNFENGTCGRFNNEQLNRLISEQNYPKRLKFKSGLIAASIFAFISFSGSVKASALKFKYPFYQHDGKHKFEIFKEEKSDPDSIVVINGIVSDTESALPGVSVRIKGAKKGVTTDKNGAFELRFDKKEYNGFVVLELSYIGYENKSVKVKYKKSTRIRVEMKMSEMALGLIGIIKQPTLVSKIKNLFWA